MWQRSLCGDDIQLYLYRIAGRDHHARTKVIIIFIIIRQSKHYKEGSNDKD